MNPDEKILARLRPGCICQGIKLIRIVEAMESGALSFAAIAAKTGIGQGPCKGVRCRAKVEALLRLRQQK